MRTLRAWLHRLGGSFVSSRRDRDFDDELESHLQLHIADKIRSGMTAAEARREALIALGGVAVTRDRYRDRRGFPVVAHLAQDLRFAARLFRRSPGFTLTAIVTTMLAVGVNVAIFSAFDAAAFRPLQLPDAGRLVAISTRFEGHRRRNVHGAPSLLSLQEFEAVRDQARAFDSLVAFAPFNPVTLGGRDPKQILATAASCGYFAALRVYPALGRDLAASDCVKGAQPVVVISDSLWRSSFSGDPSIVGRIVTLNRTSFLVVGVAPRGFTGTQLVTEDAFVPLSAQPLLDHNWSQVDGTTASWLMVMGHLRDGAAISTARADLDVIAARLSAAARSGNPDLTEHLDASAATMSALPEIRSIVLGVGFTLVAGVGLVLIIACANIANLLLARARARRREIAVRLSLGASRGRLVQQLLTESLVLAALGGAAGFLAASWGTPVLVRYLLAHLPPGSWPMVFDPRPDGRVLAYAIGLTLVTGVAFGLVPAMQTTKDAMLDFKTTTSTDRRSSRRLQSVLITVQVATCLTLLLSAGLLARGLYRANTADPGVAMNGVSVVSYDLANAGYTPAAAQALQARVLERLSTVAGVTSVAETTATPLSDQHSQTDFRLPGSDEVHMIEFSQVTPEFFDLLHIPIAQGRNFLPGEVASEGAVIVSDTTARRLWPGRDPLQQTLILDKVARPVVGVVHDPRISHLGRAGDSYVFLPLGPDSQVRATWLVAGSQPPSPRDLQAAVRAVDPGLAVDVAPLADNLETWRSPSRLAASLAAGLALLALILALTGIFGTVAYAVSRRLREIGIRVAIGAAHADVLRLIVRQGMSPVIIGIGIGLAGAAAAAGLFEAMLFGLSPYDPVSFVLAPLGFFAVALAACYAPARRALRVEPTVALRAE
jgi:putative ABC transport system permease protein